MRWNRMLSIAALGALGTGSVTVAEISSEARNKTFSSEIDVTAVSVWMDVRDRTGRVPATLDPADFEIREEGIPRKVVALERFAARADSIPSEIALEAFGPVSSSPAAEPYQVVIYFDKVLSARRAFKPTALALAEQAETLTRLGTVEILVSDRELEEVLAPTRDASAVRQTLVTFAKKQRGREEVGSLRRQLLSDYGNAGLENQLASYLDNPNPNPTLQNRGNKGKGPKEDRDPNQANGDRGMIRGTATTEAGILAKQAERLLGLARVGRYSGPRALILINDGYDVDPRDFYMPLAGPYIQQETNIWLQRLNQGAQRQEVTRQLTAQGWMVLPFSLGGLDRASTGIAEQSGNAGDRNRAQEVRPGSLGPAPFLVPHALEPLRAHADESGGELLTNENRLGDTLERLGERVLLTYQVSRPPDGKVREIEVTSRNEDFEIRAPRWVAVATPDDIAVQRAHTLATGGTWTGDLPVEAVVRIEPGSGPQRQGTVAARLGLSSLDPIRRKLSSASLRVTLGVYFQDRPPFLHHDVKTNQNLSQGDHWDYTAKMDLPADTARIVVVIEEIETSRWGSSVAPLLSK